MCRTCQAMMARILYIPVAPSTNVSTEKIAAESNTQSLEGQSRARSSSGRLDLLSHCN